MLNLEQSKKIIDFYITLQIIKITFIIFYIGMQENSISDEFLQYESEFKYTSEQLKQKLK